MVRLGFRASGSGYGRILRFEDFPRCLRFSSTAADSWAAPPRRAWRCRRGIWRRRPRLTASPPGAAGRDRHRQSRHGAVAERARAAGHVESWPSATPSASTASAGEGIVEKARGQRPESLRRPAQGARPRRRRRGDRRAAVRRSRPGLCRRDRRRQAPLRREAAGDHAGGLRSADRGCRRFHPARSFTSGFSGGRIRGFARGSS